MKKRYLIALLFAPLLMAQNLPPVPISNPSPTLDAHDYPIVDARSLTYNQSTCTNLLTRPPQKDGTQTFCVDCNSDATCTCGGPGAIAQHIGGSWTCAHGGGSSSGTVGNGLAGQIPWYQATGTTVIGNANLTTDANGNFLDQGLLSVHNLQATAGQPDLKILLDPNGDSLLLLDSGNSAHSWGLQGTSYAAGPNYSAFQLLSGTFNPWTCYSGTGADSGQVDKFNGTCAYQQPANNSSPLHIVRRTDTSPAVGGLMLAAENLANGTPLWGVDDLGEMMLLKSTVALLPTCSAANDGMEALATDATACSVGSVVTGSGSNYCMTVCQNGTGWVGTGGAGSTSVVSVTNQVITATGTYTPHAGLLYAIVECIGGGGAGGGDAGNATSQDSGASGGCSGGYSRVRLTAAQIGASQTATIGSGGTPGTTGNHPGGDGGDTSLGTLCVGKGGGGGPGDAGNLSGAACTPAVAGTGDFTPVGNIGGVGSSAGITTVNLISGFGASSVYGGGAPGVSAHVAGCVTGAAANNYGSGGGGALCLATTSTAQGGAGTSGVIIVTEFNSQ